MITAVICDDEEATFDIIQYFIKSEGFPIEIVGTAENGADALHLIQKTHPDLAFMDIHMPLMTGFEVIQKIQDVKIIIITAYDSFEHAQQALRLHVSDIIAKPINLDQLREAIVNALGGVYTDNRFVNKALLYIYQHYNENFSMEDLANEIYCTKSYISRLFREYVGETVMTYVNKMRIRTAASLLKDNELSVQQVSEKVGYQNLNNFYKYFKLYMGETPAAYAKNSK